MRPDISIALSSTVILRLFVVGGVGAVASVYNWDWFFRAGGAAWLVRRVGRDRARVICGALGVAMVVIALVQMTGPVPVPRG